MLLGKTEPRIYTKPLKALNEDTTLGYAFIRFVEDILGDKLYPWQEWLAIHALEIEGDLTGEWQFRFRSVLVLVARQNGKTTFLEYLTLFFMFVLKVPLVLGTAQVLGNAERTMVETLEMAQANDILKHEITKVVNVNGRRGFETTHSEYICRPSNKKSARSLSVDLAILDEIREHQNEEAWGAISKTTQARPNAQIWAITSAGDAQSVLLNRLRLNAHKAVGDPDGILKGLDEALPEYDVPDSSAIFEWSAEPGVALDNRDGWAQANPSLGYGALTERAIASNLATDGEKVFRTEVLTQWVENRTPNPFGEEAWQAAVDEDSRIVSNPVFGIDISKNRDYCAISVCGRRADGELHTEVVAYNLGVGWALDWLRERVSKYDGITLGLQERGAVVSSYADEFRKIDGVDVVPVGGKRLTNATAGWFDGIMAHTRDNASIKVYHINQEVLNSAVDGAERKVFADGAFLFDRNRSVIDIAPINACIMAYSCFLLDKKQYRDIIHPSAVNVRNGEVFVL